ncbi:response regulator transcription factor [Dysgonomonas sp. Marseille-P4677]|uniref:LytR/AlgR family response regulator transcription factor n=1 Tax=Dysgonomonas sp. Marseille-P4677 TaxID=2364790 RepID=UPI0019147EF1|nr:LytTR family DNA-binding domain-containing protein [Dysgonomonas sp. Marseille-P4677]MBK5720610.1 response regulator transcription factor [Dysgonomonas sp. Marseille-P4677]
MANIFLKETDSPPLKCLIVDDELFAIKDTISNIKQISFLALEYTCSSAIEAAEVLKKKEIDLMFLDINMPYLSGLDFLESLEQAPLTILTTAYSEYALDGYRLNVVDYLLKPIAFQRFFQAVQKARNIFQTQLLLDNPENPKTNLYIRQADAFQQINWEDILYIEGMQNYLKLYFKDKSLIIHQTMNSLEAILPKKYFYRIHRSYLVNTNHIEKVLGGRLFVNKMELPISKDRRVDFLNSIVYQKLASK